MSIGLDDRIETELLVRDDPTSKPRDASPSARLRAERIPALDAIRGLAILMVTGFRFFPKYDDPSLVGRILSPLFGQGLRGVDLFFVLSGFLITGILWDAKGRSHYFRNFYFRRTLRIFPLYYSVLLVTLVLIPAVGFAIPSIFAAGCQYSNWLWFYGANILISWKGTWCLGPFDHFWSLAVEEQFYLVWPLVIFLCSRRLAMKVCLLAISLSFASRAAWLIFNGNDVTTEAFTLFRLDTLAVGSFLALAARGPNGIAKWRRPAFYFGAIMIVALFPTVLLHERSPMFRDTIFACLFGSLIVVAVTSPATGWAGRLWQSPVLRFFGTYSYGMYIFQNFFKSIFVPDVVIGNFAADLGSICLARCAYLILMSFATIAAALLSWHLLEKHFLRLKPQFTQRGNPQFCRPLTCN